MHLNNEREHYKENNSLNIYLYKCKITLKYFLNFGLEFEFFSVHQLWELCNIFSLYFRAYFQSSSKTFAFLELLLYSCFYSGIMFLLEEYQQHNEKNMHYLVCRQTFGLLNS